ncbi:hypothetical protein V3D52_01550 [Pseudomonas putida]|uniref:hypothetical protein n=1 Tax=Pseudomonas putida TaxID=303 RepID=UPI0030CD7484
MTNLSSDTFEVVVVIEGKEEPITAAIVKDLILNTIDDGETFHHRRFSSSENGQAKLTVNHIRPGLVVPAELKAKATTNSLLVYLNNRIPDEPTRTLCRYLYEGDTFPHDGGTYKVTERIVDIWPTVGNFLMINAKRV